MAFRLPARQGSDKRDAAMFGEVAPDHLQTRYRLANGELKTQSFQNVQNDKLTDGWLRDEISSCR